MAQFVVQIVNYFLGQRVGQWFSQYLNMFALFP
jgi:hypothetical protein